MVVSLAGIGRSSRGGYPDGHGIEATQPIRQPGEQAAPRGGSPSGGPDGAFFVASRKVLVRLSAMPPLVIPLAMMALLLAGLLAPLPVAIPCLILVLAFVGWLAALSWRVLDAKGRLLRGLMVGLVFGALLGRITGSL